MRTLFALACLAIAGCDSGQGEANQTSVTIELPPPAEKAAEPGFSVSAAGSDR